jgi:hypothetical protein
MSRQVLGIRPSFDASTLRVVPYQKARGISYSTMAAVLGRHYHRDRVKTTTQSPGSLPQDLVHSLSLGQFIHQLVQVPDLLHELILDFLHPITADRAGNLGDVRVDPWCPGEESLEVDLLFDLLLQRLFIVTR